MNKLYDLIKEHDKRFNTDLVNDIYLIDRDVLYDKLKNANGRKIIVKDTIKEGVADGRYLVYA
jgi:hypothetical protein